MVGTHYPATPTQVPEIERAMQATNTMKQCHYTTLETVYYIPNLADGHDVIRSAM